VVTGAISIWLLLWLEGHVLFVYDQERQGALLKFLRKRKRLALACFLLEPEREKYQETIILS
jgi:hypothetical protein